MIGRKITVVEKSVAKQRADQALPTITSGEILLEYGKDGKRTMGELMGQWKRDGLKEATCNQYRMR